MSSTPAKQALTAIAEHLRQGDWGNAERVLNEYTNDMNSPAEPLDHFAVIYRAPTANSKPVIADEIRCLDCQSITAVAGQSEPTLTEINAMADRHQCLPRVPAAGGEQP